MCAFSPKDPIVLVSHNQCCCPSNQVNITMALQQTDWKNYGAGGAAELFGLKPTSSFPASKKWGFKR
jgi:hypothetical protein